MSYLFKKKDIRIYFDKDSLFKSIIKSHYLDKMSLNMIYRN